MIKLIEKERCMSELLQNMNEISYQKTKDIQSEIWGLIPYRILLEEISDAHNVIGMLISDADESKRMKVLKGICNNTTSHSICTELLKFLEGGVSE